MSAALVERKARIFRFGHYPQKRWGITAEEFRAANGESGTVPIGLDPIRKGHYLGEESVLDGETGQATFSVDGDEVPGVLHLPDWLNRAIDKHQLKISAVFHPVSKVLSKIDLVQTPHIPDAVLFAEEHGEVMVTEDDEPEAVGFDDPAGEPCDCTAEFAQTVHDLAAHAHPGLCEGGDDGDPALRQIHDNAIDKGAYCPGMIDTPHPPEVGMSDETNQNQDETEEFESEEVTFSDEDLRSMDPVARALYRRMQKFESENAGLKKAVTTLGGSLVEKDAIAFANDLTTGKDARFDPASRAYLVGLYKQNAEDDAAHPQMIGFTEDGKPAQGSRLDAFKAFCLAHPRTNRRTEKAAGIGFTDLPIEPGGDADAEREAARQKRREENQAWAKARNAAGQAN